jgi:hypothetical protein
MRAGSYCAVSRRILAISVMEANGYCLRALLARRSRQCQSDGALQCFTVIGF